MYLSTAIVGIVESKVVAPTQKAIESRRAAATQCLRAVADCSGGGPMDRFECIAASTLGFEIRVAVNRQQYGGFIMAMVAPMKIACQERH